MSRYTKLVEDLANAEAAVERWTVRVISATKKLDTKRREVKRIKNRIDKAPPGAGKGEICGWCLKSNAKCDCPPEIKNAGPA